MISTKAGGSSQKLMLFSRGNAMSGAPIISGMNQLPKPPISAGMTVKKIMISPCAVMIVFHSWPEVTISLCGCRSCARMIIDRTPPTRPAVTANIRYSEPMSLWLVLNSQRATKPGV